MISCSAAAGSDFIYGKAGNDLIDGDRWLNVRIEVHANKDGTGALVTNLVSVGTDGSIESLNEIKADMLAGRINPGQLKIVREIITTGATAADKDVALYAGPREDYTIVRNGNGTVTVIDNVVTPILLADGTLDALLGDEGTDTLKNMETLRFTNRDATGAATGTFTEVAIGAVAATGAPVIVDANGGTPTEGQTLSTNTTSIVDLNGLGTFSYQWQVAAVGTPANGAWTNINGATGSSFTPGQAQVSQILRVVVKFTDEIGTLETLTSAATPGVGDLYLGTGGNDTPTLTAFDDVANGVGGSDTLNGLAGNDTLNGGAGNDTMNGGAGNDTMLGGADDDLYIVDSAGDVVTEASGEGTDTVNTNLGSYTLGANVETLTGTSAAGQTLMGNELNNTVNGAGGNDTMFGGAGNDRLVGGAGADAMFGGAGNDTYIVDNTGDTVTEAAGAGTDTVNTNLGIYTLGANVENLNFTGGGNFAGTGNVLTNVIVGGAGNDTLDDGVGGADTMNGGAGNDTYFVRNASDRIINEVPASISAWIPSIPRCSTTPWPPISRTWPSSAAARSLAPATCPTTSSPAVSAMTS